MVIAFGIIIHHCLDVLFITPIIYIYIARRVIRDWITGCNPIFVNYFQLRKFLSIVYDFYVC
jgi:hypothetical protein